MRNLTWLLGWALAATVSAQQPAAWQWAEVPDATATAFVVAWSRGFDHDDDREHGAARVLAECRLERARAAMPGLRRSGAQVTGDASLAFVLVDAADWASGLRFCEVLLDDSLQLDDDAVAVAIARVALEADDAQCVYPGNVLECMARGALLSGVHARPLLGSASAVQGMTSARVRELLRVPVATECLGLGAIPTELRAAAQAWPARAAPAPVRVPVVVAAVPTPPAPPRSQARVDGPFVCTAFAVPEAVPRAELAVAVEVAKARAGRRLRLHGSESLARAPVVAWSWQRDDPLLVFCRRGRDGMDPSGARRDLEELLVDLRQRPPTAAELDTARRVVLQEIAGPPWAPPVAAALAAAPAALPGRAIAVLSAGRRGIHADAVAAVTLESVVEVFSRTCGPAAGWWGSLAPLAARSRWPGAPW